ncbi:glycosyltransferase [Gelidibacter pelagius]|uniref:Glycosyltransferase n=1 Tax=Gelidibacter pelagius TaxID=2819985 RepID=A0ABS3SWS2_9FLAO|nr:glycosyltransferase [Gelidibacter pelagius]MBO3100174.1 glycosyltransferase [Gelidibacter pelagius]
MKNNHLKICFLIPSVASGGIEMYLLRYLNFIKDTSQITVLVRSSQKGELYDEYKATGVKLVFLPLGYLSLSKTINHYQFYKSQKFAVICDFNANFAGLPMALGKILKVPRRIAFYRQGSNHFPPSFIKNKVNSFMNHLVYKNATHILSNSNAALDFFFPNRKASDTRFKVIYNGVNIEEYDLPESKASIREQLGIPQEAFVIGHVGRLDKAKNHDTVLKVFQQLQQEHSNFYLLLCGRNTADLIPQLEALGIKDKTFVLGYRKDVPRVLKSLDCFLFPSITEGQPNALIEAMVSDLPVITSNIPSILETLPKEAKNLAQKPTDSEALAKTLIAICYNKTEGSKFQYQEWAKKKFDAKKNFGEFNKILKL